MTRHRDLTPTARGTLRWLNESPGRRLRDDRAFIVTVEADGTVEPGALPRQELSLMLERGVVELDGGSGRSDYKISPIGVVEATAAAKKPKRKKKPKKATAKRFDVGLDLEDRPEEVPVKPTQRLPRLKPAPTPDPRKTKCGRHGVRGCYTCAEVEAHARIDPRVRRSP